jgi:pimeloyl-ACP methyl ester carboxylesterase
MAGRVHIHWAGRTDNGAPTIVLLHGITNSGAGWVDAVRRWAGHYRIAAFDALGHGLSDRFTDDELAGEGLEAGAGAIEALVTTTIDALDEIVASPAPVVLYGHSMGGAMASAVAARRPELLRGLLLEDPAWKAQTLEVRASRAADWLEVSHRFIADPDAALAEALDDPELLSWPRDEIRPWVQARTQLDLRFIALGRPEMREPWQELAAALTMPTLLMTGTEQVIVDEDFRRELAAVNPAVRVAVIEGAGHSTRRDRSDAFHSVVDPWIAERFAE